jgi:uncharacterized cofD-like protein
MNKIIKIIRWFYPGLKIKRWIGLVLLGIILILVSSHLVARETSERTQIIYKALLNVGIGILILGTVYLIKSFFEVLYPEKDRDILDILYAKRFLAKGPRIVVIGGGTGLSTVLNGLKEYTSNIIAIVTVSDEGGSSGRLREEFGILPPGDVRNCLVSLAEAPQLMRDLFQYRFKEGEGLKEHSFGNLFITAMTQVTGSFEEAIKASSEVLAIRGKVIPSTLDKIRLKAEFSDGSTQEGENKITAQGKPIRRIALMPAGTSANQQALEAIKEAEVIILGPGSLFTSVIPNLLIGSISEEIAKRNVLKLYICNVMTQHGETDGFSAADHLQALIVHARHNVINTSLVNSGHLDYNLLLRYAQDKSFPVIFDRERLKKMVPFIFEANIVSARNYLHHDSDKTAKMVMDIYNYYKKRWKG